MKAAAAFVAGLLLATAVVILPAGFMLAVADGAVDDAPWEPNPLELDSDLPGEQWNLYHQAGAQYGVAYELVAAVAKVGCDHGRTGDCTNLAQQAPPPGAAASWSGSIGVPGVLLDPITVAAIAERLAANQAAVDPIGAVRALGWSDATAAEVVAWAAGYGWQPENPAAAFGPAVLDHPNLALRPAAQADVVAGQADWRVLNALLVIATSHRLSSVGPIESGHRRLVEGTHRVSNHAEGRAVDIPVVDGQPVDKDNRAARHAIDLVLHNTVGGQTTPDEIGAPWKVDLVYGRSFTEGHDDHLHLGWDAW